MVALQLLFTSILSQLWRNAESGEDDGCISVSGRFAFQEREEMCMVIRTLIRSFPACNRTRQEGLSLERLKCTQTAGDKQIDDHDRHRHHGEGGGQRDVARCALVSEHGLADKIARIAQGGGYDKVAQRE
jgi:hypothetical protein